MLLPVETIGVKGEECTGELDDHEVDANDGNPDEKEGGVSKKALADVKLVVNLSSGDHVDNLEPDEEVEDEGHMARAVDSNKVSALCKSGVRGVKFVVRQLLVPNAKVKLCSVEAVTATWDNVIAVSVVHERSYCSAVETMFFVLPDQVLTTEEENEQNDHLEE